MQEILAVMSTFHDAELGGDRDRLATLLADDFSSIGERGYVLTKAAWIDRHDDFRYLTLQTSGIDVRRYGDAAVVVATQRSTAVWRGAPMELHTRVGQVWVRLDGAWRLAAVQFSSVDQG